MAGKYCAGKNVAVAVLKRHGFREIDVDQVGHAVLEAERARVAERFGPGVLTREGRVDRRALGARVFRDRRERRALEAIVHPAMVAEVERRTALALEGGSPVVIHAAILIPMGLDRLCDRVLCITSPWWLRLARCLARDRMPLPQALARITAQRGICLKPAGRNVDIRSIRNVGDRRALEARVLAVLRGGK